MRARYVPSHHLQPSAPPATASCPRIRITDQYYLNTPLLLDPSRVLSQPKINTVVLHCSGGLLLSGGPPCLPCGRCRFHLGSARPFRVAVHEGRLWKLLFNLRSGPFNCKTWRVQPSLLAPGWIPLSVLWGAGPAGLVLWAARALGAWGYRPSAGRYHISSSQFRSPLSLPLALLVFFHMTQPSCCHRRKATPRRRLRLDSITPSSPPTVCS